MVPDLGHFWFLVILCSTFVVVVNVRGPRDVRRVSWAFFGSLSSFAVAVADGGDGDGGVTAACYDSLHSLFHYSA